MPRSIHTSPKANLSHGFPNRAVIHADALIPIRELNERCIDLLAQTGRASSSSTLEWTLAFKGLLTVGRTEARRHVAQCPYLLVDFALSDTEWWLALQRHSKRAPRQRIGDELFAKRPAIHLARDVLVLAWHTARSENVAARVLMGLTSDVAGIIRTLPLGEINRIAEQQFRCLRPRWEDRPFVWKTLLMAAHAGDTQTLGALDIHALALLLSEMIPH